MGHFDPRIVAMVGIYGGVLAKPKMSPPKRTKDHKVYIKEGHYLYLSSYTGTLALKSLIFKR